MCVVLLLLGCCPLWFGRSGPSQTESLSLFWSVSELYRQAHREDIKLLTGNTLILILVAFSHSAQHI